jgi:hypothetical protein
MCDDCYSGALHPVASVLKFTTISSNATIVTVTTCLGDIQHTYNCISPDDGLRRPKHVVTVTSYKVVVALDGKIKVKLSL